LVVAQGARPVIVLPELEQGRVQGSGMDLDIVAYGEDDASREKAIKKMVDLVGATALTIAVEPLSLRYYELELLRSAAPDWDLHDGGDLFTALRVHKDPAEVEKMRAAIRIAEDALDATLPLIKFGMTERELAAELFVQLLRAGSESEMPFQPIVASGPNSALPHSTPTHRQLEPGDLLILDWGARKDGYISDITRTFAVGEVDREYMDIYQIVLEANAAGRSAVRPQATCGAVDQAARQIIQDAGYGDYFTHRTGHGIGLEAHEPPYIRAGDAQELEAGMTFTVEPGIYVNGKAGVRIEDNVLVTADGVETLTTLDRALQVVG
ncbi:MAG: M24 family metallopeptidase, partial [Anaerolineales bacterium]